MHCPSCSSESKSGARFCTACGAALVLACASCGMANGADDRFCAGCGSSLSAGRGAAAPKAPTMHRRQVGDGERKRITVLFSDLKGSTASIEGLDPESALS
ncbi:MAG: zinc ribbon domain-containing protein, partial [Reyranella sp.]|nr:zinc ribbon domain-containing protein [Reyranella sp.]